MIAIRTFELGISLNSADWSHQVLIFSIYRRDGAFVMFSKKGGLANPEQIALRWEFSIFLGFTFNFTFDYIIGEMHQKNSLTFEFWWDHRFFYWWSFQQSIHLFMLAIRYEEGCQCFPKVDFDGLTFTIWMFQIKNSKLKHSKSNNWKLLNWKPLGE